MLEWPDIGLAVPACVDCLACTEEPCGLVSCFLLALMLAAELVAKRLCETCCRCPLGASACILSVPPVRLVRLAEDVLSGWA